MRTKRIALLTSSTVALLCAQAALTAEPQAPEQVHTALRILASVYADMDSKLTNGQLNRLPHENEEFHDGSGAMRDAIMKEPAQFKAQVESALDKAVSASEHVADTSKANDAAKVKSSMEALATSMHALNALFPPALRAEPGSVPAPQHAGGAQQ